MRLHRQPHVKAMSQTDSDPLTLQGVVANAMDKGLAYIAARGGSGAFSVTNNLRVENDERQPR
jgi:hypothetical protein